MFGHFEATSRIAEHWVEDTALGSRKVKDERIGSFIGNLCFTWTVASIKNSSPCSRKPFTPASWPGYLA